LADRENLLDAPRNGTDIVSTVFQPRLSEHVAVVNKNADREKQNGEQ